MAAKEHGGSLADKPEAPGMGSADTVLPGFQDADSFVRVLEGSAEWARASRPRVLPGPGSAKHDGRCSLLRVDAPGWKSGQAHFWV